MTHLSHPLIPHVPSRKLNSNFAGYKRPLTSSVGIAVTPGGGGTVDALLKTVDARLYRAKTSARNRIET